MRKAVVILVAITIFSPLAYAAENNQLFPLGNKVLKERGIDFPLPFGISVLFGRVTDDTKITNIKLPLWGEIPGVEFTDSTSETDIYHLRADLWLLPFMNIYGVCGNLDGKSKTTIDISRLILIPGSEFDIEKSYHGTTFGIGTTLAYGFSNNNWFASLDINYTQTELNVVDSDIKNLMITPRIGYSMLPHGLPAFVGIGVAYMDTEQNLTVKIPAYGFYPETTAEFHIKNKKNWNVVLMAAGEINKHWHLASEIGFFDRQSFLAQLTYRF